MSGNYLDLVMSSGRHNESISCEMPEAEILYQIRIFYFTYFPTNWEWSVVSTTYRNCPNLGPFDRQS